MSKHTPGPWTISHEDKRIDILANKRGGTYDRVTFVGRANPHPAKDAQALADARLIATAPEMLEVLKQIQKYPRDCFDDPEFCRKIDDAIAKAEGEKS